MFSFINPNQTVDYKLKNDNSDNPTIWKLGVLSSDIFARITEESQTNKIGTIYKILQISIKGWENSNRPFETVRDKIFGEEYDVVSMDLLKQIPIDVIGELSTKVMEINQLSGEERKN